MRIGLFILLFFGSKSLWGLSTDEVKLEKLYYRFKESNYSAKAKSDSMFLVIYALDISNKKLSGKLSKDFLDYSIKADRPQGKAYLARALYNSFNHQKSVYYAKNSILHLKKEKDSIALCFAFQLLANVYEKTGNYDLAIKTSNQALRLAKKLKNDVLVANTFNSIGLIMSQKKNYQIAKKYFFKSLYYYEKNKHTFGLQTINTNLGIIYKNLGQYDSAFYYQKKSLQLANNLKSPFGTAFVYNDLGTLYMISNQLDSALYYYNQSVTLRKQIGEKWELGYTYNYLGELYRKLHSKHKSIENLKQAENLAKESGNTKQLYETYEQLSLTYAQFKEYDSAFLYNQKFQQTQDSFRNTRNNLAAEMLISSFEFDQKQQEIKLLQNQTQMQTLSINRQKSWLWIFGFGIFALIVFIILFIRNKKLRLVKIQLENQQKEELIRLDAQNKLLEDRKRISRELHDNIGANLTVFKEMISELKSEDEINEMKQLTEETIQELRKSVWLLNHEKSTLEEWIIRLKEYVRHLKKVEILCEIPFKENPIVHASVLTELFRVIQEGVNNALKHASCSKIRIYIIHKDDMLDIAIEDNGVGIDSIAVTGFGLKNMRERISIIQGEISFDHSPNSGTKINIKVPISPIDNNDESNQNSSSRR